MEFPLKDPLMGLTVRELFFRCWSYIFNAQCKVQDYTRQSVIHIDGNMITFYFLYPDLLKIAIWIFAL